MHASLYSYSHPTGTVIAIHDNNTDPPGGSVRLCSAGIWDQQTGYYWLSLVELESPAVFGLEFRFRRHEWAWTGAQFAFDKLGWTIIVTALTGPRGCHSHNFCTTICDRGQTAGQRSTWNNLHSQQSSHYISLIYAVKVVKVKRNFSDKTHNRKTNSMPR